MRLKLLSLGVLALLLCIVTPAYSITFDFNNGTNQGWTTDIIHNSTPITTIQTNSPAGWLGTANYPSLTGPNQGSITQLYTNSGLSGGFDIIRFFSPDLSTMTDWQAVDSYSAQILPSFNSTIGSYYSNLNLTIWDNTLGASRNFFNGTATPLPIDSTWHLNSFTGIQAMLAAAGATDYIVTGVNVNIWISKTNLWDVESIFRVDNVTPVAGTGTGGTSAVPEPSTLFLLGSGITALGFIRRKFKA